MSCKFFNARKLTCNYSYFQGGTPKATKCEGKKKKCRTGKWEE